MFSYLRKDLGIQGQLGFLPSFSIKGDAKKYFRRNYSTFLKAQNKSKMKIEENSFKIKRALFYFFFIFNSLIMFVFFTTIMCD